MPFVSAATSRFRYRKRRPSGKNTGNLWFPLVLVTATGTPPDAGTRCMEIPLFAGENTITLSRPHDPPRLLDTSHKDCAGPPPTATFFSLPCSKNPMKRLSGDQNG